LAQQPVPAAPPLRAPLDTTSIVNLVLNEKRHLLAAAAALVVCVAANLASPVVSGILFEVLVQGQPFER
jgi:hypothetical protein